MSNSRTAPPAPAVHALTKIVATVGPACQRPDQLAELIRAGVNVLRLNMAHGDAAGHEAVFKTIRRLSDQQEQPIAILVDLAGPKLRLGELPGGLVELREGAACWFVRGEVSAQPEQLVSGYERLIDELSVGDRVLLADGTVSLHVEEKQPDRVRCRVVQGGPIRSRQGINLPSARLSLPALTPADRRHAAWAAQMGADLVSLSFVRQPADVLELKSLLAAAGSSARVVAKIEKPEALEQLEAIVQASDAIMIARGDLGVETDVARVPVVQKRIIQMCHRLHKPVITATQMLDSMTASLRPTRAEATDVANAVLDGSDACMLSGETAIGAHPALVVAMMNRIAVEAESLLRERPPLPPAAERVAGLHVVTQAVVQSAAQLARDLSARWIVVASRTGATALALSNCRTGVPTIGISESAETLRQMCLYWGVIPLPGAPVERSRGLVEFIETWGRRTGRLAVGDRVVLVSGNALSASAHNMLVVHEVK